MIIWGINGDNHDAAISSVDSCTGEILFAGHAERYSRKKNDWNLNPEIIADAKKYGEPEKIIWYENPWLRKLRYIRSGQFEELLSQSPAYYLSQHDLRVPIKYSNHHGAHAAGGYFTSGFEDAAILVIDAIGEMNCASIWQGEGTSIKKVWSTTYPNSLGLFYSAMTKLVGLKPDEEEYILMGMSAYGRDPRVGKLESYLYKEYFSEVVPLALKKNLHKGFNDPFLSDIAKTEQGRFDLATAAQTVIEFAVDELVSLAYEKTQCTNIVYSGGVALNCVANRCLHEYFDKVWIMPNPGDAGNSLGAISYHLKKPLQWKNSFLGHDITRPFSSDAVVAELLNEGICGVATGRAEFGPRAFGNRSLLADPRREGIKNKVNEIKQRQKFRPFAPAVLEKYASVYFNGPMNPYMQFTAFKRNFVSTTNLDAVTHADGSARVQLVGAEAPVLKDILEKWFARTNCPILLNTSLNVKGEPLVNNIEDADRWEKTYGVTVF